MNLHFLSWSLDPNQKCQFPSNLSIAQPDITSCSNRIEKERFRPDLQKLWFLICRSSSPKIGETDLSSLAIQIERGCWFTNQKRFHRGLNFPLLCRNRWCQSPWGPVEDNSTLLRIVPFALNTFRRWQWEGLSDMGDHWPQLPEHTLRVEHHSQDT